MYLLEALEFFDRAIDARILLRDVDLDDLLARPGPRVAY